MLVGGWRTPIRGRRAATSAARIRDLAPSVPWIRERPARRMPNGSDVKRDRRLRDEGGEVGLEGRLRLGADDGLHDLALLEDLERGDRGDLVLHGEPGVLVDVQLDDVELLGVLGGDLVEDRADRATRAAPL